MKTILVIFCCLVTVSKAYPSIDSNNKDVLTSNFDSNGPQPVDEIAITNDSSETPSKRVARHYGFGGVSVGIGVPIIQSKLLTVYYATKVYNFFSLNVAIVDTQKVLNPSI